jgi:hypothetical protein
MNFSQSKQLDRIVETLALSALMQANPSKKVEKRLNQIAFPLEIELEEKPKNYKKRVKRDYFGKEIEL